ncbi:hypothetical protein [Streptomyces himastatinicus]|uniref:hypothetical protein n=1 Tax=Streptomyces himastatinicus TaxID=998084 RepID=UPI001FE110E3|nr:hypothetical protein [Streptomyces himastatinicus]
MATAAPDLAELVRADGIEFVLAVFVDLTGKPCAKLVPAQAVEELRDEGAGFAGYAAGALGQRPSDPDVIARPDARSYTPVPFVDDGGGAADGRRRLAVGAVDRGDVVPVDLAGCWNGPRAKGCPSPWAPRSSTSSSTGTSTACSASPTPRTQRPNPVTVPTG